MATPQGVFAEAPRLVNDQRDILNRVAEEYRDHLKDALDALGSISIDPVAEPQLPGVPELPALSFELDALPERTLELAGLMNIPAFAGVDDLLTRLDAVTGDLEAFPDAPVSPGLYIPDAPAMADVETPLRPTIDTAVDLPPAPSIALPEMEEMLAINLPAFAFPDLPTFNGTPPVVDFDAPDAVFINWTEPQYASELYDALHERVKAMMAGGTGLPAAIEDALFARARERDGAETRRAVQEAFDTWAGRGFSMPPGMLVKQVAVVQEQGRLRAAETNRDILIEAAKWEIENLRFAVQQGMALEQLTINLFENTVKRAFEAARFHAESQISLLNARIAVFNAKNEGFRMTVEVYKTALEAALSKLQAYKVAVEAEALKGEINKQKVEVFKARLQAVMANVDIFKALMDGAKVKADAVRAQIESYKADVQVYAERIAAEKVKFDAYESRVKAEMAKADMHESNVRAYAATVQGIASKADAKSRVAQIAAEAARVKLAAYEAELRGVTSHNDASFKKLSTEADVLRAQLAGWEAKARANMSETELQARHLESGLRTNLMYAEMKMKHYEATLEKAVKEAQIAMEAAKAIGQYSAQLAAGAMSAMHISASIGASGSDSVSNSRSQSESTSTNHNYNY